MPITLSSQKFMTDITYNEEQYADAHRTLQGQASYRYILMNNVISISELRVNCGGYYCVFNGSENVSATDQGYLVMNYNHSTSSYTLGTRVSPVVTGTNVSGVIVLGRYYTLNGNMYFNRNVIDTDDELSFQIMNDRSAFTTSGYTIDMDVSYMGTSATVKHTGSFSSAPWYIFKLVRNRASGNLTIAMSNSTQSGLYNTVAGAEDEVTSSDNKKILFYVCRNSLFISVKPHNAVLLCYASAGFKRGINYAIRFANSLHMFREMELTLDTGTSDFASRGSLSITNDSNYGGTVQFNFMNIHYFESQKLFHACFQQTISNSANFTLNMMGYRSLANNSLTFFDVTDLKLLWGYK